MASQSIERTSKSEQDKENHQNDQHAGGQRTSKAENLGENAEHSHVSPGQWMDFNQPNLLQICSSVKRPSLGKHCRGWNRNKVQDVFKQKLKEYFDCEKLNLNETVLFFTDGSVKKTGSGWGFRAVHRENIIHEDYGGYNHHKNSLDMESEAVWHVLSWLVRSNRNRIRYFKYAMILTDCKCIIDKIKNKLVRREWTYQLNQLCLSEDFSLTWMYVPGHCGIPDNEAADSLASLGCEKGGRK